MHEGTHAEVEGAARFGVRPVAHVRVCGDGVAGLAFGRIPSGCGRHLAEGFAQRFFQVGAGLRPAFGVRPPVGVRRRGELAEHHVGVGCEVGVHVDARLDALGVRPFGLADLGALALLEDDHVRRDFGMRREGRVGQADRSHELGALGDPSAGGGILLVERAFGRDESHDASRPHQVERPREEPIVHEQPLVPMAGIVDLVAAEGHVSHRDVERFVVEVCVLEAAVDDLRGRMEGAGDARGQAVELHADEAAARKRLRHGGEERARAA